MLVLLQATYYLLSNTYLHKDCGKAHNIFIVKTVMYDTTRDTKKKIIDIIPQNIVFLYNIRFGPTAQFVILCYQPKL